MNEGNKTGIFWGVAGVVAAIAIFASWKSDSSENDGASGPIGGDLFLWKDPLLATSMKVVTFDEDQGTLANFEVRKDKESGAWTIPSRNGYPADAVDQMKAAANSLIGLKTLDNPTSNAEDHGKMGVLEPKLEDLNVGDEGVGRLVIIKDTEQKDLASIIIGNKVKDEDGQIYVRIPGQDPVYTVKLDDTPLTTKFQDWIEDDLLKLSSIEIDAMQVKDYTFRVVLDPQLGRPRPLWQRKYDALLSKDGTQWALDSLQEYAADKPLAPKTVDVAADKKLNTAKLNEIQSALDDLKIADVIRKPDGVSANLRADKSLLDDQEARASLAKRGFYPVETGGNGKAEILSANGEMTVGLKDGVEYVLRFGNISGVGAKDEDDSTGGVNRYLLVTTRVNEEKFPIPPYQDIPNTVEEMEALEKKAEEAANPVATEPEVTVPTEPEPAVEMKKEEPAPDNSETEKPAEESPADEKPAEEKPADEKPADEKPAEEKPAEEKPEAAADDSKTEDKPADKKSDESSADADTKSEESGETEGDGEGSGEASGGGQDKDPQESDEQTSDEKPEAKDSDEKPEAKDSGEEAEPAAGDAEAKAEPKTTAEPTEQKPEEEVEETEEEKLERLEAVQEKITKANQRMRDERKDKIDAAKRKVRDLNARFADWYYVIPETTYAKITMKRDDLFEKPADAAPGAPGAAAAPPSFSPNGLVPSFN